MLIEEIIRSCRSESVARAAVASIGPIFARDVEAVAVRRGMSVGGFAARSVERFARSGGEAEMRALVAVMDESQEPILAGLHRILSIMLVADDESDDFITMPRTAFEPMPLYVGIERRMARFA